ncbi:hypothetical protein MIND_00790700 [Mycena indigotica]|uniref:Uncharacterized protein n=1 Tax=Mycena indigotica TaxID=2126181 RepID=A0A8H6W264_9AGAR|nr:uncharacterized protein MIND_00790700 [Mycena indigotica]KAF7302237.1 hypothetical protein MIND_00790700 [Mycena indigotica]
MTRRAPVLASTSETTQERRKTRAAQATQKTVRPLKSPPPDMKPSSSRKKTDHPRQKPPMPSWTRFPPFLPFDVKPPKRGTIVEGKGATPVYVLGWRFSTMDVVSGPAGGDCSGLHDDFVLRWADNLRANFTRHYIHWPAVLQSIGVDDDDDFYYVAGTNYDDPETITSRDFRHAKAALPPRQPWSTVNVDDVFGWYRTSKM